MHLCLSVGSKVFVHQVWYVYIVLLHALHQVYTDGYIQYHDERYITSFSMLWLHLFPVYFTGFSLFY
jgi:hypothetical protein